MEERLKDIVDNSQVVLGYLKDFEQTDSTPQGRMIAQCKWFIDQISKNKLRLPVDEQYTSTLRHVYVEGYLQELLKSDKRAVRDINISMYRLLNLVDDGKYLLKKTYYPYALRCIGALIFLLENPPRALLDFEVKSIEELKKLRNLLGDGKIEPPLINYLPEYKNLNELDGNVKYTPKECGFDEPQRFLIKTVTNLIFEGIRPDTWITPDDADRLTKHL